MIHLSFISGNLVRKVIIDKRKISLLSRESNFAPIIMDLDELHKEDIKKRLGKEHLEYIEELKKLNTEEEMAQDIEKDFKKIGWKLLKRYDSL